jgi:hypothetical protein
MIRPEEKPLIFWSSGRKKKSCIGQNAYAFFDLLLIVKIKDVR